jgi:hypothetical protein
MSEITASAEEVKERASHVSTNKFKSAALAILSSSPNEKEILFDVPAESQAESQATRRQSAKPRRKSLKKDMYAEGDVASEHSAAARLNTAKAAKEKEVIAMFKRQLSAVTVKQQEALVMDRVASEADEDHAGEGEGNKV